MTGPTPSARNQKNAAPTEAQRQTALALEDDLTNAGFEALYARLEVVSQQLEAGGLTLEGSLALYEEGMRLAQRCQALLGAVEQRIETLREQSQRPDGA